MGGRARCSAWSWAFGLLLAWRCTSIEPPTPTPEHKQAKCFVACPSGYALRPQHICRGDKTQFLDFLATGEEIDPNNPSQSRWVSGIDSIGVEHIVLEQMKAEGLSPTDSRWSPRYAELSSAIREQVGTDAVETYAKVDVENCTCSAYMQRRHNALDPSQRGLAERGADSLPPGSQH